MIVKGTMMAGLLLGGAALLAGCASDEPYSYYNPPVYRRAASAAQAGLPGAASAGRQSG